MTGKPSVRDTHTAYVASLTAADLTAGDDLVVDPKPIDWVAVRGSYDPTRVLFGVTPADLADDEWVWPA